MAKRHRTRARQRRPAESAHRAVAPRSETVAPPRTTHRPVRGSRTGYSRAVGVPSGALQRASVVERGFIVKDFRRLGIVVGIALALLVVAGFVQSALLGR
jgi:hypothetical protein